MLGRGYSLNDDGYASGGGTQRTPMRFSNVLSVKVVMASRIQRRGRSWVWGVWLLRPPWGPYVYVSGVEVLVGKSRL